VHSVGDVRDIVASVRLASDVHLAVLQAKVVDEILEEAQELLRSCGLVVRSTLSADTAETGAGWLLDPNHVGEVRPCPVVLHRAVRAVLPQERTVLLQETLQTRAARTTVEPDQDLVAGELIGRRDVPEEELGAVRSAGDRKCTGIGFANVEVDVGDRRAVDCKAGSVRVLGDDRGHVAAAVRRRSLSSAELGVRCSTLEQVALVDMLRVTAHGQGRTRERKGRNDTHVDCDTRGSSCNYPSVYKMEGKAQEPHFKQSDECAPRQAPKENPTNPRLSPTSCRLDTHASSSILVETDRPYPPLHGSRSATQVHPSAAANGDLPSNRRPSRQGLRHS